MGHTGTTTSSTRNHALTRKMLSVAAGVVLALTGCAQGGPAAEPDSTQQESTVQSTPEPSATPSSPPSPTPSSAPSAATPPPAPPAPAPAPPAAGGTSALLTVSLRPDASAESVQYTLECLDGVPGPASTLPDADAACAALARLGTAFFTARPNKDVICTQQYGGPQTASITGDLNGTPIIASFALTDGCEISRWNQVSDILGTAGAQ